MDTINNDGIYGNSFIDGAANAHRKRKRGADGAKQPQQQQQMDVMDGAILACECTLKTRDGQRLLWSGPIANHHHHQHGDGLNAQR